MFRLHGFPKDIHTDNGATFVADPFRNYYRKNGIHLSFPVHPAANSQVERANMVIGKGDSSEASPVAA